MSAIVSPLTGKSVLVSGGTGAFGKAFVKRALEDGVKRIVVLSRDEAKQAAMKAELQDSRVRYFVGDVRDEARVSDACRGVEIVVHAAALKRIEVCEENPNEAIATNITGTQSVARACIANGIERAVLLSTDKAAQPCTLYGMTKATAERLWIDSNAMSAGTVTRFACTRYGNVLGSTGSVIPTWRKQFASNGTISITDPDMTRFWMRMDDAVNLVLLALIKMRGGEVFIPLIGASTVGDLAKAVAPEATIITTGPRPGEKQHETLLSSDEARNAYFARTYFVIEPESRTWEELPPLNLPKVSTGFEFKSVPGSALTIGINKLREMAA